MQLNTWTIICSWTHFGTFYNFLHRQFTIKCVDKHFTAKQIGKYLTAPLMNILQLNTFLFFLQSSRFSLNIFKITSRVISSDTLCKVDNVLFLKAHIVVYFMSQEIEALPQIQILNSLYLCNLYLFIWSNRSHSLNCLLHWVAKI